METIFLYLLIGSLFSLRITGFITMKIGKIAAVGLGGGVIMLHIASQKGYIDINWDKINKRVDKISDKIEKETTGKSADWFEKVIATFHVIPYIYMHVLVSMFMCMGTFLHHYRNCCICCQILLYYAIVILFHLTGIIVTV